MEGCCRIERDPRALWYNQSVLLVARSTCDCFRRCVVVRNVSDDCAQSAFVVTSVQNVCTVLVRDTEPGQVLAVDPVPGLKFAKVARTLSMFDAWKMASEGTKSDVEVRRT